MTTLEKKQESMGVTVHNLLYDVAITCNSTYQMIERFVEQKMGSYSRMRRTENHETQDLGSCMFSCISN